MWFLRYPRLLILSIGMLLISGVVGFDLISRAEDPSMTPRWGMIATPLQGIPAERVEVLVTEVIEQSVREVPEVLKVNSISRSGMSFVYIELSAKVTDAPPVWARVRDQLEKARLELPPSASRPELDEHYQGAFTLVLGLVGHPKAPPSSKVLTRLASELEDLARRSPRTEYVRVFGAADEEMIVELDVATATAMDLTPAELARRIRDSEVSRGSGQLYSSGHVLDIQVDGDLSTAAEIRDLPIRSSADGRVVRVSDVARVHQGVADPPHEIAILRNTRGVAVGVRMVAGEQVDRWKASFADDLESFKASLPDNVSLDILFDQSEYTDARLGKLFRSLIFSVFLVVGILMLLSGWKSAVVVGVMLPLCSLMVLSGLWILDIPLHQMSITGLILSIGLLIDSSIIVVDHVRHRLLLGDSRQRAAASALSQLSIPLVASTATTILTFLPMAMLPGSTGEFVGSIAISVTLALVSSLLLALTTAPILTVWLNRCSRQVCGATATEPSLRGQAQWRARLVSGYRALVSKALLHPRWTIAAMCVLPLAGFFRKADLEHQFFPSAERDQCLVSLTMPAGTPIAETELAAQQAQCLIESMPAVRCADWFVGSTAPRVYYNQAGNKSNHARFAQAIVNVKKADLVPKVVTEIQTRLSAALPVAEVLAQELSQGPAVAAPIEVKLFAEDLHQLLDAGSYTQQILAETPGIVLARQSLQRGVAHLQANINDEEARRAGVDHARIANELGSAFEGAHGGSVWEGCREVPVRVRLSSADRARGASLRSLTLVGSPDGSWLPLASVADFELVPGLGTIRRNDGQRVNIVEAFVHQEVLPSQVLRSFQKRFEATHNSLQGVRVEYGGTQTKRAEALDDLFGWMILFLAAIVCILVALFQSFRNAAVVACVGALSVGFAFFALWSCGFPFGFMSILGTLGLVGIAINDAIVVLVALRSDQAARQGDPHAICSVIVRQTNHVVATSITTIVGFAPLILAGDGFWTPMAVAIAGGVTGATFLSLTFVPAVYRLWLTSGSRAHVDGGVDVKVLRALASTARAGGLPRLGSEKMGLKRTLGPRQSASGRQSRRPS